MQHDILTDIFLNAKSAECKSISTEFSVILQEKKKERFKMRLGGLANSQENLSSQLWAE